MSSLVAALPASLAALTGLRLLVFWVILVYIWLIVIRSLLSWFPLRPGTLLFRLHGLLYSVTEPYLALFRRVLPVTRAGSVGIDWSSLVALVVLFIILQVVQRLEPTVEVE
jgi:YggT family protein